MGREPRRRQVILCCKSPGAVLAQHVPLTCFPPYREKKKIMERKGEKSNPPCTFVPVPKAGRAPSLQAASECLGSERMKRAATQPASHGHHIYINVNSPAASLYNDFTGLTPFVTYPIHWNERWGLGCELQLTKQIYFTTSFKKLTKKKASKSQRLRLLWERRNISYLIFTVIPHLKALLQYKIRESLACLLNKS